MLPKNYGLHVQHLHLSPSVKLKSRSAQKIAWNLHRNLTPYNYKLWKFEHVTWKSSTLPFSPSNQSTFRLLLQSRQPSALRKVPRSTKCFCGLWLLSNSRKSVKSKLQKQKVSRKHDLPLDLMSAKNGTGRPLRWTSFETLCPNPDS